VRFAIAIYPEQWECTPAQCLSYTYTYTYTQSVTIAISVTFVCRRHNYHDIYNNGNFCSSEKEIERFGSRYGFAWR
jgi:hypothetical protein